MKYRTHVTLTLAIGLPLMAASGEVSFLNGCALGIGSLLPDIDHPSSFLGKRNKIASGITNKTLGHRGGTHSLLGAVIVFVLGTVIQFHYLSASGQNVTFWLLIGYLMHLIEDSFSKEGIHWLWPYKKKRKRTKLVYYTTGGIGEHLVLGFTLCLLLIEFRLLWLGTLGQLVHCQWLAVIQTKFTMLQHALLSIIK